MVEELEYHRRLALHEGRFLRPRRGDLDELAAAIAYRGRDPGAEIWRRALAAARIPASWADDRQRRFLGPRPRREALACPLRAHEALLFASDREGLERAESLARELVARFEGWGCPSATRVIWRVAGSASARPRAHTRSDRAGSLGALSPAVACLRAVLGGADRIYEPPRLHRRFQLVVRVLTWARRWRDIEASDIPAQLRGPQGLIELPAAVAGRSLAELDNPLEPWLELMLTGYWLRAVRRASDGVLSIELDAPFPDPRGPPAAVESPARVVWSQRLRELRLACARGDVGWLRRELPLLAGDDEPGQPRLIHFASYGGAEVLATLAERGPLELEARDPEGRTALMLAAGQPSAGPAGAAEAEVAVPIGQFEGAAACAWLLDAGAEAEARDRRGWTALHHATRGQRLRCAAALLDGGAEVDAADHRGRTPLMLALHGRPSLELVDLLLAAGADADARDRQGWTALHYVAPADRLRRAIARRLLDRGARPSRDRAGRSPAQLAALRGLALHDGGPFDLRSAVAAGPGPSTPLQLAPSLRRALLDELVPAPPDPARDAPRPRTTSHDWLVLADWLQAQGDARGELLATSLAHARLGRRKGRRMGEALARAELATDSLTRAGLDCADPFAPIRPTPLTLTRTHGFVTRARLSFAVAHALGPAPSHAPMLTAVRALLRHEPLLAELELVLEISSWDAALTALTELTASAGLRRLALVGLPPSLPSLDGLRATFPDLRALDLIGAKKIERGRLRWPGLRSLRLRHGDTHPDARGGVELALDLPDLTHLDLALPVASHDAAAEELGLAQTLAALDSDRAPALQHLRLAPLGPGSATALLAAPLVARLRSLEIIALDGVALEMIARQAPALAGLERLRLSLAPTVARAHARAIEELRAQLRSLELDSSPGWPRRPFAPWPRRANAKSPVV